MGVVSMPRLGDEVPGIAGKRVGRRDLLAGWLAYTKTGNAVAAMVVLAWGATVLSFGLSVGGTVGALAAWPAVWLGDAWGIWIAFFLPIGIAYAVLENWAAPVRSWRVHIETAAEETAKHAEHLEAHAVGQGCTGYHETWCTTCPDPPDLPDIDEDDDPADYHLERDESGSLQWIKRW